MKRLCFHYHMQLNFDRPVHDHHFTLKCLPPSNCGQTILQSVVDVSPHLFLSQGQDGFGNTTLYGHMAEEHTRFYADVTGVAEVHPCPEMASSWDAAPYQYPSAMTQLGDTLLSLDLPKTGTNLEKAKTCMTLVSQSIQYTKGVTTVSTTAEEAMALGQGVCQDYAHILLALCRRCQIPARYVAGFLVGEGYSHGWVEIFQPTSGGQGTWIGLDPTNHLEVADAHIKVAVGRDAKDCMLNRGIFKGSAWQTQWASVIVYEIEKGTEL